MKCWYLACGLVLIAVSANDAAAITFNNVVTLGDSLLDDSSGGRSPVAAEHVAQRLGVPVTKFAESGSTSTDLIRDGQHTRATAQFGEGDLAMLWIGGNDFFGSPIQAATGGDDFLDTLETNANTAIQTLRAKDENNDHQPDIEVAVFNLPDMSKVPGIIATVETTVLGFLRDSVYEKISEATVEWNRRLDAIAENHGATVVDVYSLFNEFAANPSAFSLLGNEPILNADTGCQFCVFYDDFLLPDVHPSSFAQGFIANEAISAINAAYDPQAAMPLQPLSIIEIAALAEVYAGDFDGNGIVAATDLAAWQNDYGSSNADADGDGDSDGSDFLVWQTQFNGSTVVATAVIPEPSSVVLALLISSISLVRRPA